MTPFSEPRAEEDLASYLPPSLHPLPFFPYPQLSSELAGLKV
jgi:hypothetical protein